jgi:hypothetical protein
VQADEDDDEDALAEELTVQEIVKRELKIQSASHKRLLKALERSAKRVKSDIGEHGKL